MGFRAIFVLVPILLTSLGPIEGSATKEDSYYKLRFLREARRPMEMKLIRYDVGRQKQVVETGILLTYRSRSARRVLLAGDFSHWKPLPMERGENGVWYHFLTGKAASGSPRYKFVVDGVWINDPRNPLSDDDGMGSYVSLLPYLDFSEGLRLSYRVTDAGTIEFRLYRPKARMISLVGDFNNWNPENDPLSRGNDGIWRLEKKLHQGSFRYCYVIDGVWSLDLYNEETASSDTGEICSLIRIKKPGAKP